MRFSAWVWVGWPPDLRPPSPDARWVRPRLTPAAASSPTLSFYAKGATQCTIKFHDNHKTAPYCLISGPQFKHIIAKVLRTSRSEVKFTFSRPLASDDGFTYNCMFKN